MSVPTDPGEGDLQMTSCSPPNCLGAAFNTLEPVYRGSGYLGTQGLEMKESDVREQHWVDEGVVAFPSERDATSFVARSADAWKQCTGSEFTDTYVQHGTQNWTFGDVSESAGVIAIHKTAISATNVGDPHGWGCTHAMGAKSNVVSDVFVCGYGTITDQPVTIVKAVLQKIQP
jgi:hypothetical protein